MPRSESWRDQTNSVNKAAPHRLNSDHPKNQSRFTDPSKPYFTSSLISYNMDILYDSTFLKFFAAFNTIYLAALAGAAHGMYIFSIPIVENSDSSMVMLRQFHQLITLGRSTCKGAVEFKGLRWHCSPICCIHTRTRRSVGGGNGSVLH